jgi:hypothetical protein
MSTVHPKERLDILHAPKIDAINVSITRGQEWQPATTNHHFSTFCAVFGKIWICITGGGTDSRR